MPTLAEYRSRAGLSIEDAAKRARICVAYLRRIERQRRCGFALAERLSRIYGAPLKAFLKL